MCQPLSFSPSEIQPVFENSVEKGRDDFEKICYCCTTSHSQNTEVAAGLSRVLDQLGM